MKDKIFKSILFGMVYNTLKITKYLKSYKVGLNSMY